MTDQKTERWQFGESTFVVDYERRDEPDPDRLLVIKPMVMLERYVELGAEVGVSTMVELGIYQGGSTAFFYEAFHPETLLAFELGPSAPALDRFIDTRGLGGAVRPYYGVDQADTGRLLEITRRELAGRPLDLVIDDASHMYGPTRASFEALFPLVRPGGAYVIEDWNWAHYSGAIWDDPSVVAHFRGQHAPTDLIVELVKLAGSRRDVVDALRIDTNTVEVVRGSAPLDAPIDVESLIVEVDFDA